MKRLRNQEGFVTVLTVLVATMTLTITLLSIYVYVINRSRHYARIKEAYKLIDVMAGAAKDVRYGWDLAANKAVNDTTSCCNTIVPPVCPPLSNAANYGGHACGGVCNPTTSACVQDISFNSSANPPPGACPGPSACCLLCPAPGGTNPSMCFDNPDNVGQPYCFYRLLQNSVVQYKVIAPEQFLKPSRMDKFVAKLNTFFEGEIHEGPNRGDMRDVVAVRAPSFWQWAFAEGKALAVAAPHSTGACCGNPTTNPPDYTTTVAAPPVCSYGATTNGCMTCGSIGGVHTNRQCSVIVACPLSFSPCATWDGTAANALFGQEFAMEPPGVCQTGGLLNTDPAVCF